MLLRYCRNALMILPYCFTLFQHYFRIISTLHITSTLLPQFPRVKLAFAIRFAAKRRPPFYGMPASSLNPIDLIRSSYLLILLFFFYLQLLSTAIFFVVPGCFSCSHRLFCSIDCCPLLFDCRACCVLICAACNIGLDQLSEYLMPAVR